MICAYGKYEKCYRRGWGMVTWGGNVVKIPAALCVGGSMVHGMCNEITKRGGGRVIMQHHNPPVRSPPTASLAPPPLVQDWEPDPSSTLPLVSTYPFHPAFPLSQL